MAMHVFIKPLEWHRQPHLETFARCTVPLPAIVVGEPSWLVQMLHCFPGPFFGWFIIG